MALGEDGRLPGPVAIGARGGLSPLGPQVRARSRRVGWLPHLRGDFVQAEQAYREAMAEYESGRVRAQVSRRMLAYLREQIERCRGGRPPAPKATISIEELGMTRKDSAGTPSRHDFLGR